ncbi:MAG: S4 domain-containing protein [Pseudomonadota bacterium]
MSAAERVRIDVWLWRARLVKTRASAAALVTEGAVRLVRPSSSRALDKASHAVGPGDVLAFAQRGRLRLVRVEALGARRGPPAEARALYADLEAEPKTDLGGLA